MAGYNPYNGDPRWADVNGTNVPVFKKEDFVYKPNPDYDPSAPKDEMYWRESGDNMYQDYRPNPKAIQGQWELTPEKQQALKDGGWDLNNGKNIVMNAGRSSKGIQFGAGLAGATDPNADPLQFVKQMSIKNSASTAQTYDYAVDDAGNAVPVSVNGENFSTNDSRGQRMFLAAVAVMAGGAALAAYSAPAAAGGTGSGAGSAAGGGTAASTGTTMAASDAALLAAGEPIAGSGFSTAASGTTSFGSAFNTGATLSAAGEAGGSVLGAGNLAGVPGAVNGGMTAAAQQPGFIDQAWNAVKEYGGKIKDAYDYAGKAQEVMNYLKPQQPASPMDDPYAGLQPQDQPGAPTNTAPTLDRGKYNANMSVGNVQLPGLIASVQKPGG